MSYKNEFPDFDYDLPDLGKGWVDESWHNDVCPSLDYKLGGEKVIRIWFQYDNPEWREIGGKKYILAMGVYGESLEHLMESDDLYEILNYIKVNKLMENKTLDGFPIDLSHSEPVFVCTWNGDEIKELHTIPSLKQKYGNTNLFDDEEFRWFFDMELSFEEYISQMGNGDYHIFDNMRIERI